MAQDQRVKLDSGDPFPDFDLDVVDGARTTLKAALGGGWSVVLLYRGHW
jgi:peroxiredoxin